MREIELYYQKNIRDLGGLVGFKKKKVKSGRIYRGGFLDRLTDEDVVIMESLGITDIIDFRSTKENENRPDYPLKGAVHHNYPPLEENLRKDDQKYEDGNLLWFVRGKDNGFTHMMRSYQNLVTTEIGRNALRNFFKELLAKDNGVFYFHCSQGKDRAGLAAYYVERALGVNHEDALEDYLKSNKAMRIRAAHLIDLVKDQPYFNDEYKESLIDVFSAKEEYLNAAIEEMEKMSGSVLEYIKKELQVDIDKLRKLYLE